MTRLIFIGVDRKAKGGIASVLDAYETMFPNAKFVVTTNTKGKLLKLFAFVKSTVLLFFLALFNRNTVFHIHGASYNSFKRKYVFYRIINIFKCKVVFHVHGGEFHLFYEGADPGLKQRITHLINSVDCVVCLSEQWKHFFETNFQPKRLEIVKNVVKMSEFRQTIENSKVSFLFLGFLSEGKGIWILLEAVRELVAQGKSFELVIGGNGDEERLKQLINTFQIENFVDYKGWIVGKQKEKLLSSTDVFVLPSYNEGVPISILEAMSFDKPVIATNVGGIPDVLTSEDGILIEPGDLNALVNAMRFAIDNRIQMRALGAGSSQKITAHYPETVKHQLLQIYSEIEKNESR